MKSFYAFLFLVLLNLSARAQPISNAPEQDCINGIPVCVSGYSQVNSYVGEGSLIELNAGNRGCLGSGEKNDVWYIITVSVSGTFNLNITPNNLADDYDFALWDITNNGCQDIYDGAGPIGSPAGAPFSACNYSGAAGVTGLNTANVTAGLSQWSNSINVTAGQVLALNVSNFEDTLQSGYVLDFNGSTAGFVDTVAPYFASVYNRCSFVTDSIDVKLSENVLCSTLATDGSNFILTPLPPGIQIISAQGLGCTGSNKYTRTVRLKFSGVLPAGVYTLSPASGTNGTFLTDACQNPQATTGANKSVSFDMVPPVPPVINSYAPNPCSHITVNFDRPVKCSTVATDGSDFGITGPDPVRITHADASNCDSRGLVRSIDLHFDRTIQTPGFYEISFKKGTDGNGITDTCNLVVVQPYRFEVSDAGITATANPAVLCSPGYSNLTATTSALGYGALVRCGTNGGPDLIGATPLSATVGTAAADTTNGTTQPTPFDASQANVRTQMLVSAAELQAAGLSAGRFKSVSLFIGKKASTKPFTNLNIKMGCTQLTALSGFVADLPTVYSTPSYTTQKGANKFVLADAYDWDGQSNLIVELCYSNDDSTANRFDQVLYETTPGNTVYRRSSGDTRISGCAFTNTSGNGGTSDARPRLAFDFLKPPAPDLQWMWLPPTYVSDSTSPTTLAYLPDSTRQYVIRAKDQYGCFRRDTLEVIVSIRNPYGAPANDTAICIGGSARLLVGNGVRYQWFPATDLSCTDCPDPIATPAQTTTYYGVVTDTYGCSDTLSATVKVNPLPVVIAGRDTSVLYGSGVPLYVKAPGARFFAWTPTAGLNYANVPNPIAAPLETTQYVVQVIDTNYCIAYDTLNVNVNRDVVPLVPNAFSPNGDNKNDVFQVVNLGINKLVEMRIFNRWGTMVCNTTDNNRGWDGTYGGVPQDPGVYKYLIRIVKPDGKAYEFKGDLTLLR